MGQRQTLSLAQALLRGASVKGLRAKQTVALQALLMGKDDAQAAETAGVTIRCLMKWKRLPQWQEAYTLEKSTYGLTDEQLAQRTKRAALEASPHAVKRIEVMGQSGAIERNRLYADMFLVKTAIRTVPEDASGGAVPTDLVKRLIKCFMEERERTPRDITPAPLPVTAQ